MSRRANLGSDLDNPTIYHCDCEFMTWTAPTLADALDGTTLFIDQVSGTYTGMPVPTTDIALDRAAHPEFDYCWTNTHENAYLGS